MYPSRRFSGLLPVPKFIDDAKQEEEDDDSQRVSPSFVRGTVPNINTSSLLPH